MILNYVKSKCLEVRSNRRNLIVKTKMSKIYGVEFQQLNKILLSELNPKRLCNKIPTSIVVLYC